MLELMLPLLVGGLGGYFIHSLTMKTAFKQRTIDNKIKIYDSLITSWVKMRNFIYSNAVTGENRQIFDQMYGNSQTFIGEAILICDDDVLTSDLNEFNENFYRAGWDGLSPDEADQTMEKLKKKAFNLIARMREDIKISSSFTTADLIDMLPIPSRKTN